MENAEAAVLYPFNEQAIIRLLCPDGKVTHLSRIFDVT